MEDYRSTSERRYPSPPAQRRSGEIWKARLGMGFVVALTMITGALMFRVAGLGISAALSPFQQSGGAAQITPTGSTGIPTRTPTAIAGAATAIATTVAGASTPASIPGQRPAAAPTTLAGTPAPGQPPAGATPARTVVATTPAPGAPTAVRTVTTANPGAAVTATTSSGAREYSIASGDTLGAVATRNNTTVDELVKINNLPNKDVTLQVGQKIKLP